MARPKVSGGGGFPALAYVLKKGRESGSYAGLYRRLRSHNTCKTCAVGMGGQRGGMVNEAGHFPEVCKKSVQAQAGDMGRSLSESTLKRTPLEALAAMTPRQLERLGRTYWHTSGESCSTERSAPSGPPWRQTSGTTFSSRSQRHANGTKTIGRRSPTWSPT